MNKQPGAPEITLRPNPVPFTEPNANGSSQGPAPPLSTVSRASPDAVTVANSKVIIESIQEAAVFNRPLDSSTAKQALDSPVYDGAAAAPDASPMPSLNRDSSVPSRTSTTSRTSSSRTSSDNRSDGDGSSSLYPKRLRRKLTKMKGDSESTLRDASDEKAVETVPERTSKDRPKGVLTKKAPQRASAPSGVVDDRLGRENKPLEARDDDAHASQSSTSLRDRFFPN